MKTNTAIHTRLLREEAHRLGFDFVGIARAEELTEEARRLTAWLEAGRHGKMQYMENHFAKRIDPRKLVEGTKSIVSLCFNYHTEEKQADETAPKISKYAYGMDYHDVIKAKLQALMTWLREQVGDISGRCFVDSAPVMEREWAQRAGNGWVGKNTLLIHPKQGSYFFLAELLLDIELEYDHPIKDFCGTCTRCIDACPTDAIAPDGYLLDASKCISYLTIELREAIPDEFHQKMDNWMFGCDICQDVCPWNRFSKRHQTPEFEPQHELLQLTKSDWEDLTQEVFQTVFPKSAVRRTKFEGLQRTINFLKQ